MLTGDLLAVHPSRSDAVTSTAPPVNAPLDHDPLPAPEPAPPRRRRLGLSASVSLLVHAILSAVFLWLWHGMWTDRTPPDSIAVEIVHAVPGDATPAPPPPASEQARSEPKSEHKPPEPKPPEPKPPESKLPEPRPPEPKPPEAKADPLPPPAAPPPPDQSAALAEALKGPAAEPPEEARPAPTQNEVNQRGNSATKPGPDTTSAAGAPDAPAAPTGKPVPPPAAPEVLSTAQADTSVPAPSKAPDTSPPATRGDPDQAAQRSAQLAAALPMGDGLPMPSTFRAALSALGTSSNANYRGSVFGALSRARAAVDQEARAAHLAGQVVLGIELQADGSIAKLVVIQSSGHPESDAFAIAMVRRAAPFPPPPPGTSRNFNPVISFGAS